jgi:hypothetical protein
VELRRAVAERVGLAPHPPRHRVQVDEHADLRAQHVGRHRHQQVVHRLERVAPGEMRLVAEGGEKDDGRVLGARPPADQRRGLEAVHVRHADVEEDHGEVALEQRAQRVAPRADRDDAGRHVGQDRRDGGQLVRRVVHHQDGRELGIPRHGIRQRATQIRSSPSNWSVSMGFAR